MSKHHELKGGAESFVLDNLGVYLTFNLKSYEICFLNLDYKISIIK